MENKNNHIVRLDNNLTENKSEGPVRKYLEIIKAFENLQSTENKEREKDFHAVLRNNEQAYRIFRTHKQGSNDKEKIVTDSINDNAYGQNKECIIMYTLKKNINGNIGAIISSTSDNIAQDLPVLVKKIESIVKQKGTKIIFIPGKTFEFDGREWKEIT